MSRTKLEALTLAAPAILLIVCLLIIPLGRLMWLSVSEPTVGWSNYEYVARTEGVHGIVLTTIRICVLTSLISVLFGYIVAYALTYSSEGMRRVMLFMILIPLWLSVLVRGFAWIMLLRTSGLINTTVQWLGLSTEPLPISYNDFSVLVGMVHYMLPFAILPIYANMRDIDGRLVEAARGLGATSAFAFRKIFFPLSVPGILSALTLVFIISLGFYILPLLLSGGRVTMIAEFIAVNVLDTSNWGLGSTLSILLLVAVLIAYGASRLLLKRSQAG